MGARAFTNVSTQISVKFEDKLAKGFTFFCKTPSLHDPSDHIITYCATPAFRDFNFKLPRPEGHESDAETTGLQIAEYFLKKYETSEDTVGTTALQNIENSLSKQEFRCPSFLPTAITITGIIVLAWVVASINPSCIRF